MNLFATVLLAQMDRTDRVLRWSNAGHPPPVLLLPDGTAHLLEAAAEPLLGTRHRGLRSNHEVVLQAGASVVLYTDGLIERRGVPLDDSLRELLDAVRDRHGSSGEELCDHLLDRFAANAEDDVVLVVIRA